MRGYGVEHLNKATRDAMVRSTGGETSEVRAWGVAVAVAPRAVHSNLSPTATAILVHLAHPAPASESATQKFVKWEEKQARKAKDKAKVSHLIAICMRRQANPEKIMPEWEEQAAVACAVQNMHLMATALGVAAYWSSPATIHEAEVKEHLGLGEEDKCLGMFHVGAASRAVQGGYRAKRGAMSDKVEWRV